MAGWAFVVDLVRALVFSAAHLCGGSIGGGILVVSAVVRIAMLPLTLRLARRVMAHQAKLATLKPELDRLKSRHGNDQRRLAEATMELYREHDVTVLPPGAVGSTLIQLPIGTAMYQAFANGIGPRIKFLWIGDLARPDALVAHAAAVVAGIAVSTGSPNANRAALASGAITLFFAWRLSASVGLYWVASSGVGVAQSLMLRRART